MTLRLPVLAATLALAAPVASAQPLATSGHSPFPHATRLCQRVADGKTPAKLKGSESQLAAACATLKSAYDDAVAAATPAVAADRQAVKDARATAQTACQGDDHDACKAARQDARTAIKAARASLRETVKTYRTAVRTARKAFWATVKDLRGSSTVEPDADTPPAAPAAPAA